VTTPSPSRPSIPTQTTPQQQQQQQPVSAPPIFVSGRVLLTDGTPPAESVVIERVCGGTSGRAEGYTDSKGYFSFEVGKQNNGVLQDASEGAMSMNDPFNSSNSSSSGMSSMPSMGSDQRLANCELRARLPGFRSQSVSLANRRSMDNPDVGVILLIRNGSSEGTLVSATTGAAPKDARKSFSKGQDLLKKKKNDEAMKEFEKATAAFPRFAAAWVELGKLQLAGNQADAAKASFQKAVEADSKYVDPYVQLAYIEMQAGHWEQVASITTTAVKLDPFDYPQAFLLNAIANYNLKNLDAAEKSAKDLERLDTRHRFPQNSQLLGVIAAQRQDFTSAAEHFRNYLKLAPNGSEAERVRAQLEQAEKISAAAKQQ